MTMRSSTLSTAVLPFPPINLAARIGTAATAGPATIASALGDAFASFVLRHFTTATSGLTIMLSTGPTLWHAASSFMLGKLVATPAVALKMVVF